MVDDLRGTPAEAGPSTNAARFPATEYQAQFTPDQPVAGPSRSTQKRLANIAPHRHLPKTAYGSIEYPGPVSAPSAILQLTSQEEINTCFNATANDNALLEMNYRADKTGGPARGYRVPTQKLLVKVVKRRRKGGEGGVFTSEVVGPVSQTVRFRSMADFHYTPNVDGPTQGLLTMLKSLDYESILEYQIPELNEEYTVPTSPELGKAPDPAFSHRSLLDLQPIPMFSERRLPLIYNYKLPFATGTTEVQDPMTGEIKQRRHNRTRVFGFAPIMIGHLHPLGEVPKGPEAKIKGKVPKLDKDLLAKMKRIFDERPIWMRASLLAQFTEDEKQRIVDSKSYIPACAYMFGAGPYWKCYARFGYDPRQDPSAYKYQRTYFYISVTRRNQAPVFTTPEPGEEDDDQVVDKSNQQAHLIWAEEQAARVKSGEREPMDPHRQYIFDGKVLHLDKPDYQLCDIEDEMIKKYIDDPRLLTDTCDPQNGWYTAVGLDNIKDMIKAKYVWVRDHNEPAPDNLCYPFIQNIEGSLDESARQGFSAESGDVEMDNETAAL